MNKDLGPQCYTCRKRQVKCDSTAPICQRCQKDDRECKGYRRPMKIVCYEAPRGRSRPTKRSHGAALKSRGSTPDFESTDSCGLTLIENPSTADRSFLLLLDSMRNYETHVLPNRIPSQPPFRRFQIDYSLPLHEIPKTMQYCLIVSFQSMRPCDNAFDLLCHADLFHYRGLSLTGLQELLPAAREEPLALALLSSLVLMGADLNLPSFGNWLTHFEAVRHLIAYRGGIIRCMRDLPAASGMAITSYVMLDVFSGTTCKSRILRESRDMLSDYLSLMSEIDEYRPEVGFILPSTILRAIISINILRVLQPSPDRFDDIEKSIQLFKPAVWAISKLQSVGNLSLPLKPGNDEGAKAIVALTCFANCFQDAALIYLILSSEPQYTQPSALTPSITLQHLTANINLLFNLANSSPENGLHSVLWKFVEWPMFIETYARIGWPELFLSDQLTSFEQDLSRFEAVCRSRSRNQLNIVFSQRFLREIKERRTHCEHWNWDDGFTSRHALIL